MRVFTHSLINYSCMDGLFKYFGPPACCKLRCLRETRDKSALHSRGPIQIGWVTHFLAHFHSATAEDAWRTLYSFLRIFSQVFISQKIVQMKFLKTHVYMVDLLKIDKTRYCCARTA